MTDIGKIKLVVWDLDRTFWEGVLSEGGVTVPERSKELLKCLTDCGIINTICSRNDFAQAKGVLEDAGVWELFVEPSISWGAKGPRLKQLLERLALRPADALFIDDNPSNRGEAAYFLPEIQAAGPDIIPALLARLATLEKTDPEHLRLQRYKVMERRNAAAEASTDSEKFLYDSDIRVTIHHDCLSQKERILELVNRTNQLNFTKKRLDPGEMDALLDEAECGYISSKDRFGDYGIVGFYALKGRRLEQFCFSCRTMGQRIEQWVYARLGFPEIEVKGEVATQLNGFECPGWINQEISASNHPQPGDEKPGTEPEGSPRPRILLKGPCDLSHSLVYLKGSGLYDAELGYTTDEGKTIEAHNHSVHIEGLHTYSEQDKRDIAEDCIFVDPPMLDGRFFTGGYDLIVLSTSVESYYHIYRNKTTGVKVAYPGACLTDPKNWPGLAAGTLYTGGNSFTEDYLRVFSEKYEYAGFTRPEMYLEFLSHCLEWLPGRTQLCLILGATRSAIGPEVLRLRHERLNAAVRDFARMHPRIRFIEIDSLIRDDSDFTGNLNHFSARVYYELAQAIRNVIRETTGVEVESLPRGTVRLDGVALGLRRRLRAAVAPGSPLYKPLKAVYDRLYKKRV